MTTLAIGSAFRNSAGRQVDRWVHQVVSLRNYLHTTRTMHVRGIAVEGDSKDKTRDYLVRAAAVDALELDLRTCNHGGPVFGSTEDPRRMSSLSEVGNEILEGVRDTDDFLLYVESDLLWSVETITYLLDTLAAEPDIDVLSPMIFAGVHFYDVWAFRKNGLRYGAFHPYHPNHEVATPLTRGMDSVGSCLLMRACVAREVRMIHGGALVEWCSNARSAGYEIAVHGGLRVEHPA